MLIDGFAIAGYRSFGEIQYIAPCETINLFIGGNDVGSVVEIADWPCPLFQRTIRCWFGASRKGDRHRARIVVSRGDIGGSARSQPPFCDSRFHSTSETDS
jgi:hypothetical protein